MALFISVHPQARHRGCPWKEGIAPGCLSKSAMEHLALGFTCLRPERVLGAQLGSCISEAFINWRGSVGPWGLKEELQATGFQ